MSNEEKKIFDSGASSSENLPPYELITDSLLDRVAERLRLGEQKYGRHNWRQGLTDKQFIQDRLNHAFKHLRNLQNQIEYDDNSILDDDAAAIIVNIMFIMEYQLVRNGLVNLGLPKTSLQSFKV